MPSLEDLKSDPVNPTKKKGFIPSIKTGFMPTIEQGPSTYATNKNDVQPEQKVEQPHARKAVAPRSISMTSNGSGSKERVSVDMNEIPKGSDIPEGMNVKTVKSIEDDILGPGGPFEQMRNRMVDDYKKDMQKQKEQIEAARAQQEKEYEDHQAMTDNGNAVIADAPKDSEPEEYVAMDEALPASEDATEVLYQEDDEEEQPETSNKGYTDRQIVELEQADNVASDTNEDAIEEVHDTDESVKLDDNTYTTIEDPKDDEAVTVNDPDDTTTPSGEDRLESLKALVSKKIKPVSRKLDISGFTVAAKGTVSNAIFDTKTSVAVAKWILPATGITIQMKQISGADIESIREDIERGDVRSALQIIYNHIVSPKPKSFEMWLKSTANADYDHLFMALYIASFSDSNFIPLDCVNEKCGKTYLTDNIKISDMIHYTSDENKKKFLDLYKSDRFESKGLYATSIIPISNKFAIAFKEPSLYDIQIERQYFDNAFTRKYERTINYVPYINRIYAIDYNSKQLVPVAYVGYNNDLAKTSRSKIERYDSILNTFSADEHSMIAAYVNKIDERTDWVTYRIPETTCSFCGAVHPASGDITASSLVFLRSRLAVLAIS